MYEYLADFERWKNTNNEYLTNNQKINELIENCKTKCIDLSTKEECLDTCKSPLVDIENFIYKKTTNLMIDVYELCTSKLDPELNTREKFKKLHKCTDYLYKDNENIVKREIIKKFEETIKFIEY